MFLDDLMVVILIGVISCSVDMTGICLPSRDKGKESQNTVNIGCTVT